MSNLKKNFFYSSFLTGANYLFPLLTFPYVTRVLGVANLGICGYVDSIVNYFVIFSMLGISTVGIRAIAETKNNRNELNKAFSSLIIINSITTFIGIIILVCATLCIDALQPYRDYLYVGIFKILTTYLLAEWFYKGIEDFKYITIRTLIVKCAYVVSIFIFVKTKDDNLIYYVLSMLMVALNALFNIIHTRKFVSLTFRNINLSKYIKPLIIFGSYLIITSMYTTFNVTYLGYKTNPTEVGYYTTATRLHSIILSLFSAFTGVMLPRMSSLLSEKKNDEFIRYIKKSATILIGFSIPFIMFAMIFAPQIILIIAGNGYEGAITPMRLIVPLVFVLGYEQLLVIQTLNPLKKDLDVLKNSIIGAFLGLILNIILIPHLMSIGTAIVWCSCEVLVLICSQYYVTKYTDLHFPYKEFIKSILFNIPLLLLFVIANNLIGQYTLGVMLLMGIILLIYSFVLQIMLKNELALSIVQSISSRFTINLK